MWPLVFQKASLSFFPWMEALQEAQGEAEESHIISLLPHSVGQSAFTRAVQIQGVGKPDLIGKSCKEFHI